MFDLGAKIRSDIAEHGWTALGVFGTEDRPQVPFTYTVGLTERFLPEIIVFGLSAETAHGLISQAITHHSDDLKREAKLENIISNYPAWIRPVNSRLACRDYTIQAAHYYGFDVDVVQLIWPDQQGRFPWDTGVDPQMSEAQNQIVTWEPPRLI